LVLVDDGRRVAEADQEEVQDQPAGTAVAVEERVDLLKPTVEEGHHFGESG
jgi:hypothetical protein